ncbi:hypothetical protein Ancab_016952 [Ancistrocladus abbreviatus]
MASKLHQLQSKVVQASQFVAKHGTAYHKQLLEQNKEFIQEPPTVEKCNLLAKQLFYTRLSSIPGRYELFKKEIDSREAVVEKPAQDLKVEDVGIAVLFGLECYCWFCAGEIVGRVIFHYWLPCLRSSTWWGKLLLVVQPCHFLPMHVFLQKFKAEG